MHYGIFPTRIGLCIFVTNSWLVMQSRKTNSPQPVGQYVRKSVCLQFRPHINNKSEAQSLLVNRAISHKANQTPSLSAVSKISIEKWDNQSLEIALFSVRNKYKFNWEASQHRQSVSPLNKYEVFTISSTLFYKPYAMNWVSVNTVLGRP